METNAKMRGRSSGNRKRPKMMTQPSPAKPGTVEFIPLNKIIPSATNPRKRFDESALNELASSIKQVGVLHPIIVRPEHPGSFEIVAGERRFKAAHRAGMIEIPAIVRDLDDESVLEIQILENVQREDLSAIEEADSYRTLIDVYRYTVGQVAEKVHKSRAFVYARLRLCLLPEFPMNAVIDGSLSPSTALLIAQLPNEQARVKAAKELYDDQAQEWLSFRRAKEIIRRNYLIELKGAPFSVDDESLLPSAGACTACPKMAGNNRELYPDGRADICTDPACYQQKARIYLGVKLAPPLSPDKEPHQQRPEAKPLPVTKAPQVSVLNDKIAAFALEEVETRLKAFGPFEWAQLLQLILLQLGGDAIVKHTTQVETVESALKYAARRLAVQELAEWKRKPQGRAGEVIEFIGIDLKAIAREATRQ